MSADPRVDVVAHELASTFATDFEDLMPRQQQRFRRDAGRIVAALDKWAFFNPEMPE